MVKRVPNEDEVLSRFKVDEDDNEDDDDKNVEGRKEINTNSIKTLR